MSFPTISTPVTGGQFSAADGTTLVAANAAFVKYSGASDIVTASGLGKIGSGTYSEHGYHVDPGSSQCEMIIDIPAKSSGNRANGLWGNFFSGTAPGSSSADRNGHQWEIDFSSTTSDALFIYTVANGTNTQVATSTATTFSAGDSIGVRVSGTTNRLIEIFRKTGGVWNQTPVLTYTDTGAPTNRQDVNSFAFGLTDSSGGPARIDNLVFGATAAGGSAPANTVAPAITGTLATGSTQTCSTGTWTNSPTSFTYQWKRAGTNISGATSSTYVLVEADEAQAITCTVTATNASGSASADSNTITPPDEPANTVAPAITGTATTGSTLSCSTGTWTNTPTSFAYQWKRAGTAISGATSSTYVLVIADEGQAVTCTVTATNGGGSTSADSNSVTPTAGGGGGGQSIFVRVSGAWVAVTRKVRVSGAWVDI